MRERIFAMVEKAAPGDYLSKIYDFFISVVAIVSIIPMLFKESSPLFSKIDTITVYLLFMDYVFRWMTYDFKSKRLHNWKAFLVYPITPYAIIDFLSIIPSLGLVGNAFRIFRMMRIFKVLHYSKSFTYIINVFKNERKTLCSVLFIALAYIFVSALAMFSYEPDTFGNFFDALYWATTALTTVGYGDVFPHSDIGQLISMISSLFGIAVIAMPAGVVTAGFMDEINRDKARSSEKKAGKIIATDPQKELHELGKTVLDAIDEKNVCSTGKDGSK